MRLKWLIEWSRITFIDGLTLIHDLNGDQSIDQLETMAVAQRIGLVINNNIL